MDRTKMLDMLTDACGTIDRLYTVGLFLECLQVREEAYLGDACLYRGIIAIEDMVRRIREDVQAVADWISERDGQCALV